MPSAEKLREMKQRHKRRRDKYNYEDDDDDKWRPLEEMLPQMWQEQEEAEHIWRERWEDAQEWEQEHDQDEWDGMDFYDWIRVNYPWC
jgi:hypothetical protein